MSSTPKNERKIWWTFCNSKLRIKLTANKKVSSVCYFFLRFIDKRNNCLLNLTNTSKIVKKKYTSEVTSSDSFNIPMTWAAKKKLIGIVTTNSFGKIKSELRIQIYQSKNDCSFRVIKLQNVWLLGYSNNEIRHGWSSGFLIWLFLFVV